VGRLANISGKETARAFERQARKARMTIVTRDNLIAAALKLPHKERAKLASQLIRSLDDLPEAEWEEVWAAEAERRLENVRAGRSKETPLKEVFARARALQSR